MIVSITKRLNKLKEQPCVTVRDYIRCATPMIGKTYYKIHSWDDKTDVAEVTVFKISNAGNIFYRTKGKDGHEYNYIKACVYSWYPTEKAAMKARLKNLKRNGQHYQKVAEDYRKRHNKLMKKYIMKFDHV